MTASLPELVIIPCPRCAGEGGFYGDDTDPDDICGECEGSGELEVCSGCGTVPTTENGLEVCACVPVALGVAA